MIERSRALELAFDLLSQVEKIEKLDKKGIEKLYPNSDGIDVWAIQTEISDKKGKIVRIGLHIKFLSDFPISMPKAYLDDDSYEKIKFIPHIDTERFICSFNHGAYPNTEQPENVVIEVVDRAKRTIEKGLSGENDADYIDEYDSYWKNKYGNKDAIDYLSVANLASLRNGQDLKVLVLSERLNGIEYFIHDGDRTSENLKQNLNSSKLLYREIEPFYLGKLEVLDTPPFALTNRQAISIIASLGEEKSKAFKKFLNNPDYPKIVLFSKGFENERGKLYGWLHGRPNCNRKGFRPGNLKPFQVMNGVESNISVLRLTPQDYNPTHLLLRSTGADDEEPLNLAFIGLGSVGSHLVSFFSSLQKINYNLIDPDGLFLENLGRHWLGFESINQPKVEGIRNRLVNASPFVKVESRNKGVFDVFNEEPNLLNDADLLIVAIGEYNIEKWLAEKLKAGEIKTPIFFVWVEPYLLGGHCIYLHPDSCDYNAFFDVLGFFKYNAIEIREYKNNNPTLSLSEAGCQGFTPYSSIDLVSFLGALFSKMNNIIKTESKIAQSFTWIGNKELAESLNIKMSDYGNQLSPYTITNNLNNED
ncbi:E2/UBC family protein [Roseivirga pacifica]